MVLVLIELVVLPSFIAELLRTASPSFMVVDSLAGSNFAGNETLNGAHHQYLGVSGLIDRGVAAG